VSATGAGTKLSRRTLKPVLLLTFQKTWPFSSLPPNALAELLLAYSSRWGHKPGHGLSLQEASPETSRKADCRRRQACTPMTFNRLDRKEHEANCVLRARRGEDSCPPN